MRLETYFFVIMIDSSKKTFAVLVHACDRYELLYSGFAYFFKKYWDSHIPCDYFFATEELKVNIEGFENIQSGKGEWSTRLSFLLENKISADYIIYFQEDMWLKDAVSASFFAALFDATQKNNWQQVKLHTSNEYKTEPTAEFIEGLSLALINKKTSGYLMSHQITLWRKDFLLQQLQKPEHPWRNERRGTDRLRNSDAEIYQIDYFLENGQPPNNKNLAHAPHCTYFGVSANAMMFHTSETFIEEMLADDDAQIKSYAQKLRFNFENNITHDGKKPARKLDVFQKIKKWFR